MISEHQANDRANSEKAWADGGSVVKKYRSRLAQFRPVKEGSGWICFTKMLNVSVNMDNFLTSGGVQSFVRLSVRLPNRGKLRALYGQFGAPHWFQIVTQRGWCFITCKPDSSARNSYPKEAFENKLLLSFRQKISLVQILVVQPFHAMATLALLDRRITYDSAAEHESDVIEKLTYVPKTESFYDYLVEHKREIEALTAHHLGLGITENCVMSHWKDWIRGRFNVCVM